MSKSQPVTQNTTQNNQIPGWLTSLSQQAGAAGANLPQYTPFTGAGPAGLTPDQLRALGLASTNAGSGQGVAGSGVGTVQNLTGFNAGQVNAASLTPQIQGLLSPYTQDVVNATNAQIDRNTASSVNANDNSFAAQHAFGGTRQAVADAVTRDQGDMTKASTAANLNQSGYNSALSAALSAGQGNQNAAIGSAGVQLGGVNALNGIGANIGNLNAQDLNGLLTAGGTAQNSQTAQNMFGYQNYLNQYQIPDQQAQTFASILGSLPHSTSQTGTTSAMAYTNPYNALAGLGGAAAAALPAMLSDRRLKTDATIIGKLFDGTPVYRFRYIGSGECGRTHIGVMAQDVEEHSPHAVTTDRDGIKWVDHKAATDRAARLGA